MAYLELGGGGPALKVYRCEDCNYASTDGDEIHHHNQCGGKLVHHMFVEAKLPDLKEHVRRRGYIKKHGKVERIDMQDNLLNQPMFHTVTFADGFYCTFCPGYNEMFWWRHRGGGRYGPRRSYEGWI